MKVYLAQGGNLGDLPLGGRRCAHGTQGACMSMQAQARLSSAQMLSCAQHAERTGWALGSISSLGIVQALQARHCAGCPKQLS